MRLYEEDYVDSSALIEFKTLIGGSIGAELSVNTEESRIEILQPIEIIDDKYM